MEEVLNWGDDVWGMGEKRGGGGGSGSSLGVRCICGWTGAADVLGSLTQTLVAGLGRRYCLMRRELTIA